MRRSAVIAALLVVVVATVVALAIANHDGAGDVPCAAFRFSRDDWVATGDPPRRTRLEQGQLIVRCKTFQGKSKKQVRRTLGPPAETRGPDRWQWPLALDDEFGMKLLSLVLRFDGRGRVSGSSITRGG